MQFKIKAIHSFTLLVALSAIPVSGLAQSASGRMLPAGRGNNEMPAVLGAKAVKVGTVLPSKRSQFVTPAPGRSKSRAPGTERVLVVYDAWGPTAFMGRLFGRQMTDLLSHYGYAVDAVATQDYTSGMIDGHRATIYLGVLYDTDLPATFKSDVLATTKPVCWTGYNLWKIAWSPDYSAYNSVFETKFGMRFLTMDSGYVSVTYKSTSLGKSTPESAKTQVLNNANKAKVLATAKTSTGASIPYILQSKNFYFVGDNPIGGVEYADIPNMDRTVAFLDVLHDVIGTNAQVSHPAILRIEDVSAQTDPAALRKIADYMYAEGVPFVVSTIPLYRDPLGYWDHGFGLEVPFEQTLANAPDVVAALNYMVSKGGQIIMHGTTHQYNDVQNYNSGVSGDDWEFFRLVGDGIGGYQALGPVYEDNATWVADRISLGKNYLAQAGFTPTGWLTPHYLASPVDYAEFAKSFQYSLDPTVNFVLDPNGYLYYERLYAPYPIKDGYGRVVLPESVNYISPYVPASTPTDLVNRARKLKVLRDSWAGMYFHPFLPPTQLRAAVRGIKKQGFTFVAPNASFGPR